MKKTILILLLFILSHATLKSQVISISPNQAAYGQSLTTTITLTGGVLWTASPPLQLNDIYLKQGNSIIYSTNFNVYPIPSDSLSADFTIPAVTPPGYYEVHVITYMNFPFPQPVDNLLTNGMLIGHVAGFVDGIVYFDANQNGIRDVNEVGLPNQQVLINPTGYVTLTNQNGHYSFATDTASLSISLQAPPAFTQTSLPLIYNISIPPDSSGNDFGLYEPPNLLYSQDFYLFTHAMRCLYTGFSGFTITNTCPLVEYGSVTVIHSSNLTFASSSIPPSSTNGDTISWQYQIQPFSSYYSSVNYMNPPAGDTVSYIVIDSLFDSFHVFQKLYADSFQFVVSCSVDPNDKSVSPAGEDAAHYTLKNVDLDYTIRFQNTGTDTAYTVIIKDTLDPDLDLNTLAVIGWSHPYTLEIDTNRIMTFTFNNILLPDSNVDEANSHGYIAYRIHPMANIANNTVVNNKAYIYFDFNSAVATNKTMNTLVTQIPVGISETSIKGETLIYPNPVTGFSILRIPQASGYDLIVYDVTGKVIIQKIISTDYIISKNKFQPGMYFFQLLSKDGKTNNYGKFIIAVN